MAGKRRRVTRKLKLEAASPATKGGMRMSHAARDLDIHESGWAPEAPDPFGASPRPEDSPVNQG